MIKYGGAAMVDPALKRSFAEEVVLLQSAGLKPVIVHGGGPEITKTLEKLGRKSEFADGQRITGKDEVQVVEMVLTGRINTEIVGLINSLGGNAIGLSGKDGRLLIAHKLEPPPGKPDLGFVGEIESVNADLLDMFLERGYMPVISPVGFGKDGASYNINADVAAGEIAAACGAERLIFLTDVAGILDEDGTLISEIRAADLEARLGRQHQGRHARQGAGGAARAGERRARRARRRRAPAPQRRRRAVHRPRRRDAGDLTCGRQDAAAAAPRGAARRDPRDPRIGIGAATAAATGRTARPSCARRLRARGFKASQATLSRDMAVIGAQPRRRGATARATWSTATAARCRWSRCGAWSTASSTATRWSSCAPRRAPPRRSRARSTKRTSTRSSARSRATTPSSSRPRRAREGDRVARRLRTLLGLA